MTIALFIIALHALPSKSAMGGEDPIKTLAKKVYTDIFRHSVSPDQKQEKISYLYLHGCPDYGKQEYTNAEVNTIMKNAKAKFPTLSTENEPLPFFPRGDEKSNLFVGTAAKAKKILPEDNRFDCPHLAILGRGRFAEAAIDVDGWPKGDDGFIAWKTRAAQRCQGTQFYYYIDKRKPKAELILEQLERDHVNVVYRSDFE